MSQVFMSMADPFSSWVIAQEPWEQLNDEGIEEPFEDTVREMVVLAIARR
jgi:hypothetical protein